MLRRVGIAQAIVNEPELLLLDEPTAGLDPEQRVAFRGLLRDLGQRATVVVSTHLVEDVGAACAQVALMDRGKIVFQGTPGRAGRPRRRARRRATRRWSAGTAQSSRRPGHDRRTAPGPPGPGPLPAARRPGLATARLLRLELRHNAMLWLLPVVLGAVLAHHLPQDHGHAAAVEPARRQPADRRRADFTVPVAGAAAWMGSREARRRVSDLVTVTARPRWARLLATWAATTGWAMVGYLGCLAALYGVTAHQASWGGPLWWPAAVAAAACLAAVARSGSRPGRCCPAGSPRRWPRSPRSSWSRSAPS